MTNINQIVERLIETANQNPYGFTINILTWKLAISGYSVSYESTQDSNDINTLTTIVEHALQHDNIVGGWINIKTDIKYFDSSKVFRDKDEAIEFGKLNKQIAIYDLTNGLTIYIK